MRRGPSPRSANWSSRSQQARQVLCDGSLRGPFGPFLRALRIFAVNLRGHFLFNTSSPERREERKGKTSRLSRFQLRLACRREDGGRPSDTEGGPPVIRGVTPNFDLFRTSFQKAPGRTVFGKQRVNNCRLKGSSVDDARYRESWSELGRSARGAGWTARRLGRRRA